MRAKLGIKESEQHLVLKYRDCLHRYIQTEIEFLDITTLDIMSISNKNLSRRGESLDLQTPHSRIKAKESPTHKKRDKANMVTLKRTIPRQKPKKGDEKLKKDTGKWCEYHKIPWNNTEDCRSKQSLVAELKSCKSEEDSDSKSNPKRGNQIIDVEPNSNVATTKFHPGKPE
jgi:hypothetical protein